jgi:hypothetical protein
MPFIRYASKTAARRAQRVFLLGAAQFGVLSEILGAVPSAVIGRASSAAIATAMGYLGVEAGHAAEDPPRADFRTPTRSKRRRLALDQLGKSRLERETVLFADAVSYGAAYLAAFVRAVERSQTAEAVDARDAVADRVEEADIYARRAADALRRASERDLQLIHALEAEPALRRDARDQFRGPSGRTLLETPFWEKLPTRIIELFSEAHLDPRELSSYWDNEFPNDPIDSAARTLREASLSSVGLATDLEDWGPASEKPPTPEFFETL